MDTSVEQRNFSLVKAFDEDLPLFCAPASSFLQGSEITERNLQNDKITCRSKDIALYNFIGKLNSESDLKLNLSDNACILVCDQNEITMVYDHRNGNSSDVPNPFEVILSFCERGGGIPYPCWLMMGHFMELMMT